MPMDGLTIGAIVCELNSLLLGARIDKINQPEKDELVIACRNNGENYKLLLCSNPSFARVNLTRLSKPNPLTPTNFCMLLRKHLTGGRLAEIKQISNERILLFSFDCLNDFNEPVTKRLIVEIMGKHSNIIFTDSNGKIFDSIRRVNSLMSRMRVVQPGLSYELPPSQNKLDPFSDSIPALEPIARKIGDTLLGLSASAAEELAYLISENGFNEGFSAFMKPYKAKDFSPVLLLDDSGFPVDFFATEQARFLPEFQEKRTLLSDAVDDYFALRDRAMRTRERSHGLRIKLTTLLEKAQRKNAQQHEKLLECADMEKFRIFGELITANLFLIKRGDSSVTVKNYYDSMNEITIELDNTISPNANAQKYFKHYNKLKTASHLLCSQMDQTQKDIDYLSEQLTNLENCENEQDIEQIRAELILAGYVTAPKEKQKKIESKPMRFLSATGIEILVGKNNMQNDKLTLQIADSEDLWMHVKDVHGSHVIIRSSAPDDETVNQGALLAAYYSKARQSANVAVDYTLRRFVKKPSGAGLGKVIYTNQSTCFVTPDEALIRQIKRID